MLGRVTDAEDVLQDAYLRIHGMQDIVNPEAFLVTTVTRLCIDRLKSARARRETYVGPWLPEPIFDIEALSPQTTLELADDISLAMMLVLERLSPSERAAFLLHDIFDLGFAEIALVLGRSEAACRQLASRARKAVRAGYQPVAPPLERQSRLLAAFGAAVSSGDVTALVALLREDAVLLSDGGGLKPAALNPILGADKVARYLLGAMRKFGGQQPALFSEARMVNGALGVVSSIGADVEQVMSILADGDRIAAIYVVRNPQKLMHLRLLN
jgi:RNA polymerase sigma-70 factor (ECF subfamily)